MKKLLFILMSIVLISCGSKSEKSQFDRYSESPIPERAIGIKFVNDVAPLWFDHQAKGMCWVSVGEDVMKKAKKDFLTMVKDSTSLSNNTVENTQGEYLIHFNMFIVADWMHQDYIDFYSAMDKTNPNNIAKFLFYKFINSDNKKSISKSVDSDIITYTCQAFSVDPNNEFDFYMGTRYLKSTKEPKTTWSYQYYFYPDGDIKSTGREFTIDKMKKILGY